MKTTENNTMEPKKEFKYRRPNSWPCKGSYEVVITAEEWQDHGITHPGYYKLNKRCAGAAGIVTSIWLDAKEIERINRALQ